MIETKTIFDAKVAGFPVIKFQLRKAMPSIITLFICSVLLSVLMFIYYEDSFVPAVIVLCFGIFFIPFIIFFTGIVQFMTNKTMKLLNKNTCNFYRFDEKYFFQKTIQGNDYMSTSQSSYSLLYKVYETKTHFFLMISNRQTHVIPKTDFIRGTADELVSLLSRKLGKKFKSYVR